jgi:pimeloyl-ACP methyl ester carboxylesterase
MAASARPPEAPPPVLTVPAPAAVVDLAMGDGAVVRLRRHGNPAGPRLALSHGNGLAMDAYFPFWRLLLADHDVILFDQRNHGANPLHGLAGHHTWEQIVADNAAIRRGIDAAFGARPVAGCFHSLSAVAALKATLEHGPLWQALCLYDPPIFPRPGHALETHERLHMDEMAAIARRRPERYESPAAFAAVLARRPGFARWAPGTHLLFAEATLRRDPVAGDWALACPREFEAHIFATNLDPTIWPRIREIAAPLRLIGADVDLPGQQAPALLTAGIAADQGLDYVMVPGTTHFLQVEAPAAVRAATAEFLARAGFKPGG